MADLPDSTIASIPNRRGFLRQLCALPMIGGGVTLIGAPAAVAEPVTDDLLKSYKSWLIFEERMLCYEMAGHDSERARAYRGVWFGGAPGNDWHFQWGYEGSRCAGWPDAPQPSTRAALVMSAVGCDWRRA